VVRIKVSDPFLNADLFANVSYMVFLRGFEFLIENGAQRDRHFNCEALTNVIFKMASAPCAFRTVIIYAIKDDIGASLQAEEAFMSSTTLREQCFHACCVLREEHSPPVSFKLIGDFFEVGRGTICNL
jgi:hypothetical protein